MKKLIIYFYCTVFSLTIYSQIPNPSFEEWHIDEKTGSWKPVGWDFSNPCYDDNSVVSQSSEAIDGMSSIKFSYSSPLWSLCSAELENYGNISINYPSFKPFFYISYWVKFEGFTDLLNIWSAKISIHVQYLDSRGNTLGCSRYDRSIIIPNNAWQRVSWAIDENCEGNSNFLEDSLIQANISLKLSIGLEIYGTDEPGAIFIDNIQVSSTPFQTPFIKPKAGDHFLTGKEDTIKWNAGMAGQKAKLWYSIDEGANYMSLADDIPADTGVYIWHVPDTLLTAKAKVKLTDQNNGDVLAESDNFLIKPYLLTRLENNGELMGFNPSLETWDFTNDEDEVWPDWYYNQFNYNGIDENTGQLYDHLQGDSVFYFASSDDHPGWQNYVAAYGIENCYDDLPTALYNHKALLSWKRDKYLFEGAGFGIAATNALAFESKDDFLTNFPDFGYYNEPFLVTPGMGTVETVTELYAHQFGNPTIYNDIAGNGLKTPAQTIEDIKKMFSTAHTEIRTLSMFNNIEFGAHTILPYRLEQDTVDEKYYYIYVYDSEYRTVLDSRIRVDVSFDAGSGFWEPLYGWPLWGGTEGLYLEIPATQYYVNPSLKKAAPSIEFLDSLIDVSPNDGANVLIIDKNGNTSGFTEDEILNEIPGAHALRRRNGSESTPYRYLLHTGEYTIDISNAENKTAEGYIFTKDQIFYYERKNAKSAQTDRLFFDGSLTAINTGEEARNIKLMLILEEEGEERIFKLQPFKLEADDSIKIVSPDNDHLILYNYGSTKQYGVELSNISHLGYARFVNDSIPIKANTSHIFNVNWTDIDESMIRIYVDEGIDVEYEDTLWIDQKISGFEENMNKQLLSKLDLQLWPNPTKGNLKISYVLKKSGRISIKIYDSIGKEVLSPLKNIEQVPGKQTMEIDLSKFPAGIYYYRFNVNESVASYGKIIKL